MPIKRAPSKSTPTRKKSPSTSSIQKMIHPVSKSSFALSAAFYGKQGTGKTTVFGTFPTPSLLIDISEKGTDSVCTVKGMDMISISTADQLEELYYYLIDNPTKYKSVGLDAVTALQALAMAKIRADEKKNEDDTISRRQWGRVSGWMSTWLLHYRDLIDLGINVCFIAHDRTSGGEEEDGADGALAPSIGPRLMPSVAATLNGAVSVLGNTFIREETIREKGKKPRKKTEYAMRVGPHEYYVTKIRSPKEVIIPSVIVDPTFDKIIQAMRGK